MSKTYSLFLDWFRDKRSFSLAMAKANCDLSFRERVLYSFLIDRLFKGGATRRYIRRRLRLDSRSLRKLYESLVAKRYVKWDGNKLVPLEPERKDWFVWRTKPGLPWHKALTGFPCCCPPKGWTLERTAVYFCLLVPNVQSGRKLLDHQKRKGIAAMLGLSPDTVRRALACFEGLGLLRGKYLRPPSDDILAGFEDKPAVAKIKPAEEWSVCAALDWTRCGPDLTRHLEAAGRTMLAARYSRDDVISFIKHVGDTARNADIMTQFFWGFDSLLRGVEEETARNRDDGKFKGRNGLGLLEERSETSIRNIKANDSALLG